VDIGTGAGIGTFGTPTTGYTVKATSSNGTFHGWQSTTISSGAVSFGVTFGGSASNWLGTIAVFHP
jgi:hypothetical protein